MFLLLLPRGRSPKRLTDFYLKAKARIFTVLHVPYLLDSEGREKPTCIEQVSDMFLRLLPPGGGDELQGITAVERMRHT